MKVGVFMIYLDYAANTPVDKEVLTNYIEITNKYIANPNSSHPLGLEAKSVLMNLLVILLIISRHL